MLCETDEAGTDFLSTFFTFAFDFRNFKDWITFSLQTGSPYGLFPLASYSKANLGIIHGESLFAG